MTYTVLSNVALGDLIDETTFNDLIANDAALYSPPSAHYELNEGSDYTTTSTTFATIDATSGKLSLSITLDVASDVLVAFHGSASTTGGTTGRVFFDFTVDGVRNGGDDGILNVIGSSSSIPNTVIAFARVVPGLAAGSHTFVLQWKVNTSGTATLYAGAGTSNGDLHPQFFVRKV